MKKRGIGSLLLALFLVFSFSLLQGCKSIGTVVIGRIDESRFVDNELEEDSDETDNKLEKKVSDKDKKDESKNKKKTSNNDKVKNNSSSKKSDTEESNDEESNNKKSIISKNSTSDDKSKTSDKSSNGVYDKQKLQELLKTNIALAKDTEVEITGDISVEELGNLASEVAENHGFAGYVKNVAYGINGKKARVVYNYVDGKDDFLEKFNYVEEKVNSIVARVVKDGMTDYEKELALHDYIVNYGRYDIENYEKNTIPRDSYTAYGFLANKKAVCAGYAELMYRLLNKAGIEAHVVVGNARDESHAWNLVKIDGKYYHLDPTFDDPITKDGSNVLSYSYFNLTDKEIANDHSWDKNRYPAATSTEANYFYVNDLVAKNYDDFCNIIKRELLNNGVSI